MKCGTAGFAIEETLHSHYCLLLLYQCNQKENDHKYIGPLSASDKWATLFAH